MFEIGGEAMSLTKEIEALIEKELNDVKMQNSDLSEGLESMRARLYNFHSAFKKVAEAKGFTYDLEDPVMSGPRTTADELDKAVKSARSV